MPPLGTSPVLTSGLAALAALAIVDLSAGANAAAAPFTPASLADLFAWYRGDKGITQSGGLVSQWKDQGTSGDANRHLAQATGAQQPTFTATDAGFNNRPTISCAAAGTWLVSGTFSTALAQPSTMYFVGKIMTANGYALGGTAGARNALINDSGPFSIYSGSAFLEAAGSTATTPSVVCAVFNGASSAIYVNHWTTGSSGTNPGASSMTEATIGGLDNGGSQLAGGTPTVAEYILCSTAHSAGTRQQVVQYLGTRYGFSVSP